MGVSVRSLDMYYYLFSAQSLDSSQEATLSLFPSPFSQSSPSSCAANMFQWERKRFSGPSHVSCIPFASLKRNLMHSLGKTDLSTWIESDMFAVMPANEFVVLITTACCGGQKHKQVERDEMSSQWTESWQEPPWSGCSLWLSTLRIAQCTESAGGNSCYKCDGHRLLPISSDNGLG